MTMVQPPRRFGSTEHLASEAVAAYVDGELRMAPYLRAAQHLAECPECAAEVEAQQQARRALRAAAEDAPEMSSSLRGALCSIPSHLFDAPGADRTRNGARAPEADAAQSEAWFAARRWAIRRRR
ncbi:zf-HC2 domain-containing protein [Rhodococcus sp. (in: high G+C Gram-positive bacteria)]|uniref:zf-HC2 domain-containing protein n=1 Tax=Rhodococcus sp. TaxID=1831 RepID=UPI00389064F6